MINVSNEFKQLMGQRTDFKENAEITFADGTILELKEKDFTVSNNNMNDASETNGIPLGVAVCKSIQIELMNDDDRFSYYDFFGAKIRLYLTFQLSSTVERIEKGTFTVLTPETYGTTVIITALDDMYKADVEYETTLPFPSTIGAMFRDACTALGISQGTTTFLNDDFIVEEKPTDITFRQLFGYIAMIAGGNARIDRTGRLRIISYNFEELDEIRNSIDGGAFKPWKQQEKLDGGDFTYNTGDVADGGNFTDAISYHILTNWKNVKVDTDDIVITGVTAEYTNEKDEQETAMYGKKGYLLQLDNPLIKGKETEVVKLVGNVMVGGRFRQFSGDLVANPTCEFMDLAVIVDRKSNVYVSFITDINFEFFGFTTLKNSAEPALRNSAKSYSNATKSLVKARELIKDERTAREKAVEQLAKDLSTSSGLYMTQEEQADGSIIYYMHDKPTLTESMIVWKLTALAFGVSTDGGKTYPYGFTVDGTTITRLLYAEGIDADYIDTGAIRITDTSGNTMFLADYDTKQVYINANNVKIGKKTITDELEEMSISIDEKIELKASKGELSSLISIESGKIEIKSNRFSWDSTYSSLTAAGKLTAKDVDLTGKITADSGKIGGFNITDYSIYYKYNSLGTIGGIYIGTNGISVGNSFKVDDEGNISLGLDTDIEVGGVIKFNNAAWNGVKYGGYTIFTINSSSHAMEVAQDIEIASGKNIKIANGDLTMAGSTSYIKSSTTGYKIKFESSRTTIMDTYSILGKSGGQVGFFGSEGAAKKTISIISSPTSATASTCATKINELINSLKAYNLIG